MENTGISFMRRWDQSRKYWLHVSELSTLPLIARRQSWHILYQYIQPVTAQDEIDENSKKRKMIRCWSTTLLSPPRCTGPRRANLYLRNEILRFFVDYQHLDSVTTWDAYPLQYMDDHIDSLGSAQVFPTLDGRIGYRQINVEEEDRESTAFTTHRRS